MLIVKISGGLGNQMFQYAFAKYYQCKGRAVYLDISFYRDTGLRKYELNIFPINIPELPKTYYYLLYDTSLLARLLKRIRFGDLKIRKEQNHSFDQSLLEISENCMITGYFQTEKYFKLVENELLGDFKFQNSVSEENIAIARSIERNASVSVHIRRGDFVTNPRTNEIHGVLPLQYYNNAINIIRKHVSDPKFFVFTDDSAWAKEKFHEVMPEYTLVEGNTGRSAWQDMYLMSLCKHNIIANSSFSWWGAWLNRNESKIVIGPRTYCSDPDLNAQTNDIIPEKWIRI